MYWQQKMQYLIAIQGLKQLNYLTKKQTMSNTNKFNW
jgi:hypothetical protein